MPAERQGSSDTPDATMDGNESADDTARATVFNPGLENAVDSVIHISLTGPAKESTHDVEDFGALNIFWEKKKIRFLIEKKNTFPSVFNLKNLFS